jgi:hypothetical protein
VNVDMGGLGLAVGHHPVVPEPKDFDVLLRSGSVLGNSFENATASS